MRVVQWEEYAETGAIGARLLRSLGYDVQRAPLASEPEVAEATRLLRSADVLVSHLLPRRFQQLGIRLEDLRNQFPDLVIVSITPFGLTGELRDVKGDSLLAEAFGGLANMVGEPDQRPLALGGAQGAHAAVFAALFGMAIALLRRSRGEGGALVDVAMSDVVSYLDWKSDVTLVTEGVPPTRQGTRGLWRILPAAAGWVGVIFQDKDWPSVCRLVGDARLADARFDTPVGRWAALEDIFTIIGEWVATQDARNAYESAQRLGLPFGYAADIDDLIESPHYLDRDFVHRSADSSSIRVSLPFRERAVPPRATPSGWDIALDVAAAGQACGDQDGPSPSDSGASSCWSDCHTDHHASAPFYGLKVLDLGTITAGAATSRLLADYGACVLKIEAPNAPDSFRTWDATPNTLASAGDNAESPMFRANNVNKLGLALDLKSSDGRRLFFELVRHADVLVENFRVGVTERLGIDYPSLHQINPELLYVSLSSAGQSGREAKYSSFGSTIDLVSGLGALTGYEGGGPLWSGRGVNYPDQVVSLFGAGVIAHYLLSRRRGVQIDLSQRELVTWSIRDYLENRDVTSRGRVGNQRGNAVPHDTYPCQGRDRWIALACWTDEERAALSDVIGLTDSDCATAEWWQAHREQRDQAVAAWTRSRSRQQAAQLLRERCIAAVPVTDAQDRASDPRYTDRGVIWTDTPYGRIKGAPFVMSGVAPGVYRRAPQVGQDSRCILRTWCAVSDEAFDRLVDRAVTREPATP